MKFLFDMACAHDTREKIIIAALQLIAEGGANLFTASNLIQRAGISKGALYHYFPSLEEVLLASMRFCPQDRQASAELDYEQYPSLRAFLQAVTTEVTEVIGTAEFLSMMLFFAQKALQNTDFRRNMVNAWENDFQRIKGVTQHFYHKEIPDEHLYTIGSLLFMTVESVATHGFMHGDKNKFMGVMNWLIQAIERDLEPYEAKTPEEMGVIA